MNRPTGLDPFVTQSRLEHALTVVGAVAICLLAYFGAVVAVYGELSILALEANVTAQRVGGVAAGVAVWGYFGIAFVRGYGGPVLNSLPYPLVIVLVTPFLARWALFGPDVPGLISRFVGLFVLEPLVTAAIVVAPGLSLFVTILTIWASTIGEDARKAWEREHLTAAFYEEFVDVSE